MKILKFGSATIADVKQINNILQLIGNQKGNIIVLSSIKGFAEYLEEISDYYYHKNTEGAFEVLNQFVDFIHTFIKDLNLNDDNLRKCKLLIDNLIEYTKAFDGDLFTLFEKRALLAQGEILTSAIFEIALLNQNKKVHNIQAIDIIRMDKNFYPDMPFIKKQLSEIDFTIKDQIYITQGYICRNSYGEVDDLRKGGSDFSTAILGAALQVDEIQIWGNQHVLYNIDHSLFNNAKIIESVNYDEAAELAYFGTKVLHPSSIFPAKLANIPIRLMCVDDISNNGTLISNNNDETAIKAIGTRDNITLIQIKSSNMLLAHGFLSKIFEIFDRLETSIDMLATSEIGVSLTIDNTDKLSLIEEELKRLGTIKIYPNMLMISIVGYQIMHTLSISGKILNTLKEIPTHMISYGGSDLNISFLVKSDLKTHVLTTLHKNLFND